MKHKMTKFFAVVCESGANQFAFCYLGGGFTKLDAIADAYGPGGRLSRNAFVREFESRDHAAAELGDLVFEV